MRGVSENRLRERPCRSVARRLSEATTPHTHRPTQWHPGWIAPSSSSSSTGGGTASQHRRQRDRDWRAPRRGTACGRARRARSSTRAGSRWDCRKARWGILKSGHLNLGAGRVVMQDLVRIGAVNPRPARFFAERGLPRRLRPRLRVKRRHAAPPRVGGRWRRARTR